jgi:uncharacterized membrane protein
MNALNMESISGLAFAVITLGYNISYFWYTQNHPKKTHKGRQNIYRECWITNIIEKGKSMTAVHQLRNMTLITTFLASSTLIFMGVAVSFTGTSFPIQKDYADYKLYSLIGIIALAFFNFLFTLRTASEITILIESSPSKIEELEGIPAVQYLTKKINQAFLLNTLGMRCLYYSIPLIFWFFDPYIFIFITVILTMGIAKFLDF